MAHLIQKCCFPNEVFTLEFIHIKKYNVSHIIISIGLPTIEFDNPDLNGLHEGVTYNAAIKSIPVALRAEWKVRQEPSGDLQVIDTHNPLYRGSTVALPRPRLVVNRYGSEQLQSFQLEVFNFIGSSRRDTYGN